MLTFVTLLKNMKRSVTRGTKKGHLFFKGQKTNLWLEELLRCTLKPGGSSLAPYYEGILGTPSSLAPFQAPARLLTYGSINALVTQWF